MNTRDGRHLYVVHCTTFNGKVSPNTPRKHRPTTLAPVYLGAAFNRSPASARRIRDQFADHFMNAGAVDWQWERIEASQLIYQRFNYDNVTINVCSLYYETMGFNLAELGYGGGAKIACDFKSRAIKIEFSRGAKIAEILLAREYCCIRGNCVCGKYGQVP